MERKEIHEAIISCDRVIQKIDGALNRLKSARNWGFADLLGGGFLVSMFKHSKLNDVERDMKDIQYELGILQRELKDVSGGIHLTLNNTELNQFFDIFMDNIFSDFNTQSKIGRATSELLELRGDVTELKERLEFRLNEL